MDDFQRPSLQDLHHRLLSIKVLDFYSFQSSFFNVLINLNYTTYSVLVSSIFSLMGAINLSEENIG